MKPEDLVSSWLTHGRAGVVGDRISLKGAPAGGLAEKLRRAYDWIATEAVASPYYDLEFGESVSLGPTSSMRHAVPVHRHSYSSYVLLPLLNLVTSQRLLFIGAPGRGKSSMAMLMALVAGHPLPEVKRSVQHGHPQLTLSDLLGSPLPSTMIRADDPKAIHVAWRGWLTMRVKVIDEYNRIPTKTQSALLSLMGEGYAEMFEQVVECGTSAWYLTANDELGGGTFPVIEALRDRIDVVVRCAAFNAHFLHRLVERVELARSPLALVPADVVFTPEELDAIEAEIRAVPVPPNVLEPLGSFAGQLDFCRRASNRLEFMNKDTLHLAGRTVAQVCNEDCPLDKLANACSQTENGLSARTYQALLLFSKALAYFRGAATVEVDDIRQMLPWVLHEKLKTNLHSAFFQRPENQALQNDRADWIRNLFDQTQRARAAYANLRPVEAKTKDEVRSSPTKTALEEGLAAARRDLELLLKHSELNGVVHEDLVFLKGLCCRYENELGRYAPGGE